MQIMAAKLLPYGLTDYKRIITDDYYYVDKTGIIPQLERTASYLFLIRPRRFGKSLFLAMLQVYYDVNEADNFDRMFGGTWIGQHPTREHNSYLILRFNFSGVSSDPEKFEDSFERYCASCFDLFAASYARLFDTDFRQELREQVDMQSKMDYVSQQCQLKGLHIYLLIDEYDNFTNTILSTYGNERYHSMTHGEGLFRYFFNKVKEMTTGPDAAVRRMFITGVSPVSMDDVTSGFNIGTNITTMAKYNSIIGFTEAEVRAMLTYYKEEGLLKDEVDDVLALMKPWYDCYCFSEECCGESMYNADMTLYFLSYYLDAGRAPKDMLDTNIRTDYNKLRHLISVDKKLNGNFSRIRQIVQDGEISAGLVKSFPAEKITDPNNFVSLLYYFGLLSIRRVERGKFILGIPNLAVREQMYSYLVEGYEKTEVFRLNFVKLGDLLEGMAYQGDWRPVFDFLSAEVNAQTKVRQYIEGETLLKGFMQPYLACSNYFILYPEYELNKGYADFYFQPNLLHFPDLPYSYIVEVKYLHRGEPDEAVEAKLREAAAQLSSYAGDELIESTRGTTTLRRLAIVWRGWEMAGAEEVR